MKIFTRNEIVAKVFKGKKICGGKIGFTSGAFDILHYGHLKYLEKAKLYCDILVVGVNSDSSIKQYKSKNRPIISEQYRAGLLSGLWCVDYVFIFDEKNNNKNIELIRPDLYIKANQYTKKSLSSASLVEKYGGKVLLLDMVDGLSTTKIIDKIKNSHE